MAFLVDLKTNLKSLKFGRDAYRNGSSGLPYIQTQIPGDPSSPGTKQSIWQTMQNGYLDLPIRGGQVGSSLAGLTFTRSSQIDYERINAFLKDATRGPAFIRTQVGLQLSNPKTESSIGSAFGTREVPGPIENTRVYNLGVNTLAQVKAAGTGAHATRHGLVPFNLAQKNYFYTVNQQNVVGGEEGSTQNRLVLLNEMKMTPNENQSFLNPAGLDINQVNKLGISLNRNILFQYLGGPGSVYGVGSTTIFRTEDTAKLASQNVINPFRFYQNYPNVPNSTEPVENRLVLLRDMKIYGSTGEYGTYVSTQRGEGRNFETRSIKTYGISTNNALLFFYPQGPGSIIKNKETGKIDVDKENTGIRRYDDTTKIKSRYTMTYENIGKQNINDGVYYGVSEGLVSDKTRDIQDFRAQDSQIAGNLIRDGYAPMRFWRKEKTTDYRFFVKEGNRKYVDRMNIMDPKLSGNQSSDPWSSTQKDGAESTDDTIKFLFEAISNDDPKKSLNLFFRAFLNGGITDNHGGSWSGFKYMGRGEDFYTYQGFNRTVSFSFRVYAASEEEMIPMYNRVNALTSQVYPDYSSAGLMRAPIVRLTIGDYLYRVPGFLESVNLSIENNAIWETNEGMQLPHRMDVSVGFRPVLNTLPRRVKSSNVPALIANRPGIISTSY